MWEISLTNKKLENLAYRLKDLNSLRNLFSELNFDFADKPVDKDNWSENQKKIVTESRIIASKNDYQIYYIQTDVDSLKELKEIASKIIKSNHGFCMICSHHPNGFKWIFSNLSKEFSKSFTESRHVPLDISPDAGVPKNFVEFLDSIKVTTESTASSILHQMSEAFDSFAVQIHNELTVNVFEALRILSEGIILDKSNKMTLDEQTLEQIREPVFILLYRIIFILYAEDRNIFPIDNKTYYDEFSIKWLKKHRILNTSKAEEYSVLDRLSKFFRLIELGSEDLGYDPEQFFMKSYYGRLFDRKIHSKLDQWKIKDKYLLDAISLLTRTRDKNENYFFLDYSALETRHLGSVYEHLLEYHLTIKDRKIADLPDAKDRKTSGSYYTPQHIVDYIVENTVGPLIDDIIKKNSKDEQIDKILELNILDPAMGSGHFLIGVTNYMARRICEIEYDKEYLESAFIERKRDVVRRCVYGVDLNPLAVNLAQVSLWLETLSSEKPLSFLSAHLKSGNSLIGSSIDVILDKQTTLMESSKGRRQFKKTVKDFIILEQLEDDTASAVKAKTEKYDEILSKGTIYYDLKFLLNAKVAKDFGVDVPPIGDYVAKIGENSLDFYADERWQQVKKVSQEHSFFHWDLEFPDIFYGEDGKRKKNVGFDAVVGNPPYVRQERLGDFKEYLSKNYKGYAGTADLYVYFLEKGLNNLKNEGFFGVIVSNKWSKASYGENIRTLLKNYKILQFIDFGDLPIFKDATTYPCILIIKKTNPNQNSIYVSKPRSLEKRNFQKMLRQNNFHVLQNTLTNDSWAFQNNSHKKINDKINKIGIPLEQYCSEKINRGLLTGLDKVFVIDEQKKNELENKAKESRKFIKPYLVGKQIKRYYYNWENTFILLIKKGEKIERFPSILNYLKPFKKELEERWDKGDWFSLRTCSFYEDFMKPKIIIAHFAKRPQFTYDDKNFYVNAKGYILPTDDKYLLGILNSSTIDFFSRSICPFIRGEFYEYNKQFVNQFPIPQTSEENKRKIIKNVEKILENNEQIIAKKNAVKNVICADFSIEQIPSKLKNPDSLAPLDFLKIIKKLSKPGITEKKLEELCSYFSNYKSELSKIENEIIELDSEIDEIVFSIFNLSKNEITIIMKELSKDRSDSS